MNITAAYRSRFGSVTGQSNRRMLQKVLTLADMEAVSEKRNSRIAQAYLSGAAGDEITLRANRERWARIQLNPDILVDVSDVDLTTRFSASPLMFRLFLLQSLLTDFGTRVARWAS